MTIKGKNREDYTLEENIANQVAEDLNNRKRELSNKSVKRDFRVVKVKIVEVE